MKESDILHQNGKFWVMKDKGLFWVMKDNITHATSVDDIGYTDINLAIAYCNYQAKRQTLNQ